MASRHSISKIPNLTAPAIQAAKPRAAAYAMHGPNYPGLAVRISPAGGKVFRWHVLDKGTGKTRVVTLGAFTLHPVRGRLTLTEAGGILEKLKAAHAAGTLPAAEADLRDALRPPVAPTTTATMPLREIAEAFYERRIIPHRKRPEAVRNILDRDILPGLGARPIGDLSTRECAALVESVVDRPAPVHAGKVLAILKQLLRFAQARGFTDRNPALPLDPKDLGVQFNVSQRALSEKEIPLFWNVLKEKTKPADVKRKDSRTGKTQTYSQAFLAPTVATRAGLRLLLLTGARSGELLLARWEHVDLKAATWTIPVENQKLTPAQAQRAKPFVIPLPPMALALFEDLRAEAKKSPWVLASESEVGHLTDKVLGRAMRRLFAGEKPLVRLPGGDISPHDLRRTMRTHLGKLRVPPHVTERCLNHSLGRIVQTYDQGDYLDERREALERWEAYVDRLVTGKGAEVVALNATAAPASR